MFGNLARRMAEEAEGINFSLPIEAEYSIGST